MIEAAIIILILVALFAAGFVNGWLVRPIYDRWQRARLSEKIAAELMPLDAPMERPFTGKLSDPANSPFVPPTTRPHALRKALERNRTAEAMPRIPKPPTRPESRIEPPPIEWGNKR